MVDRIREVRATGTIPAGPMSPPTPARLRLDLLSWAALAAAITVTASGEYQLGLHAGFGPWIAAGIPASLDVYALRAMRARRDVLAVVVAMIAVNAASHLVTAGLLPVNVPFVVAVSAIAPLVFWRVHHLAYPALPARPAMPPAEPAPVILQRAPEPPPMRIPAAVPPVVADKPYKELLPPVTEPPAEPEGELTAIDFLARQHKVRPDQIRAAVDLLAAQPALSGRALGTALETTDRYGRRVLAAARELAGVRS